jgi:hypothetical protein
MYLLYMYEHATLKTVEAILRRELGLEEEQWRG